MTKPTGGARSGANSERGAALVEFAILTPLLLLLLLGIIEFGWFMSQNNDVRHGAREAARLAAVDADTANAMGLDACGKMPLTTGATVEFSNPGKPAEPGGGGGSGQRQHPDRLPGRIHGDASDHHLDGKGHHRTALNVGRGHGGVSMMRFIHRRSREDRGAALVEMAVLTPLLVLLLVGIIEFGWLMSQNNDVRHGAREAARLAAINSSSVAGMGADVCDAMDITTPATVTFTDNPGLGNTGTASVQATVTSLTGFPGITIMLPGSLTSDVDFTLQEDSTNWATGSHTC